MANSEDYLDGLLSSVKSVRNDVAEDANRAEANRKQREEQKNRIMPNEDFMEANGLNDFNPKPSKHENLRRAFSEDDFLRSFEAELELEDTDADSFIRDFEEEIAREELLYEQEMAMDDAEEENEETDEEMSFLDNIENIVNQAKEQIEQGDIEITADDVTDLAMPMEESPEEEMVEVPSEESTNTDEDEIDLSSIDTSAEGDMIEDGIDFSDMGGAYGETIGEAGEDLLAKFSEMEGNSDEPVLLDENSEDTDLMDLLSGDEDLDGIGSLLQADDESETLEEAQEEFDLQADGEGNVDDLLAGLSEDASEEESEQKKGNPIANIIEKIKGIFKKNKADEEEEVIDISSPEAEDLSQENLDILKSLDEAEAAADGQEKGKKEKKEKKKKEKKEKKPKEPKEKKPKKEKVKKEKKPKEPDNSPKIPGKVILVFVVLGVSFVFLVNIGQKTLNYNMMASSARSAYNKGDYFSAYETLMGAELTKEEDEVLFKRSRILGDLQKRTQEYSFFMGREDYAFALDSLIIGVARYDEYYQEAKQLGIEGDLESLGEMLVQSLYDQFGLTKEDAVEMYKMDREDYSIRIDEILEEMNLQ